MKIIQWHNNEKRLIKSAIADDRAAQQRLFDKHAPKMLGVCRSYVGDIQHAEEVMLNGFLKVFTQLKSFKNEGSFEGWIRKIMVRASLSFLRKQHQLLFVEDPTVYTTELEHSMQTSSEVAYLQGLIDSLPVGYRTVFVLYAVEGYKHHEIASELKISESTSKSQLHKARKLLRERLAKQNKRNHGAIKI